MSLAGFLAEPLAQAARDIADLQARAAAAGITLRAPPEDVDPRTCCGRGCHPCMYTYYFDAMDAWRGDAKQRLGTE